VILLVGILLILFIFLSLSAGILTDWLWFESQGFSSVFWTILGSKLAVFFAFALLFLVVFSLSLQVARVLSLRQDVFFDPRTSISLRVIKHLLSVLTLILSLIMGGVAGGKWETILRYLNRRPFRIADPIFSRDIGFYVFTLPLYQFLRSWALETLIITTLATFALFLLSQVQDVVRWGRLELNPNMKGHLSILGALILLLIAWGYRLNSYELLYSTRASTFFGATYADVHAQLLAYRALFWIACLCALLSLVNIFVKGLWLPIIGVGLWVVAAFLVGGIYPNLVQSFTVKPTELAKEEPYIKYNIKYTGQAYGLDKIEEQDHPGRGELTYEDLAEEQGTLRNVRLWDYRPLRDTYRQLQEIRPYYEFADVDIDRYRIDGEYRQVTLSAREMASEQLPSRNWINEHLVYTHGYGLVMSPVSEIAGEGLPELYIRDLPPASIPGLKIERPEIYYGEKTDDFVLVRTSLEEFDYPKGDENVTTIYQGGGGVPLNSALKRLLFAYRLGDMNFVLSRYIIGDSRVMLYRNIHQRVRRVAPFLRYDHDPYLVLADGRLFWIQDAYTVTDRYPYSKPYKGDFNYIRNSVKIVIDAYSGHMAFYLTDPEDPLVQVYAAIFPDLFASLEEMPLEVRAHLRYPEGLFIVQADLYSIYHMQDATVFYNREDAWAIPHEIYLEKDQPMEPYYVIMKLSGEEKEEFLLMQPFTPAGKDNMVAWMAARSDGENYGKVLVYKFPKQALIYGPLQIDARIDQDTVISQQLSLWHQRGSQVIRGNTLVIPVKESVLYVEPLYLQAEKGRLPELKRVIVAYGGKIAMESTLEEALVKVIGAAPAVKPEIKPEVEERGIPELAESAKEHYHRALEYLREGNWARYGEELEALRKDLEALVERTEAAKR